MTSLGTILSDRLQAVSDFEKAIEACKKQEEEAAKELALLAEDQLSKPMQAFLSDFMLVEMLIRYGRINYKFFHKDDQYEFKGKKQIVSEFEKLAELWSKNITVEFSSESHRTTVKIMAKTAV